MSLPDWAMLQVSGRAWLEKSAQATANAKLSDHAMLLLGNWEEAEGA